MPARVMVRLDWFSRPGIASTLIPREGTVHEWITSDAVISRRISVCIGTTIRLFTSRRRNSPIFSDFSGTMKESNLMCWKSLYS